MTRYLVEEIYELVDAILIKNPDAVCEEAGDVLFQLLFTIALYGEAGHFGLAEVVDNNLEKMVRRHPHVFGDAVANSVETVRENWDKIKRLEKGKEGDRESILDSVPRGIPALLRAAMVSERAAKTGFDWSDLAGVMKKTMEEWQEFSQEVERSGGHGGDDRVALEFGDLLFTMVNVARFAKIDPEMALIRSTQKFEKRFHHIEEKATQSGRQVDELSYEEMHQLWDEAKREVG